MRTPNAARIAAMDDKLREAAACGPLNVLLIGAGPHARHFYIPVLAGRGAEWNVHMRGIVELEGAAAAVQQAIAGMREVPTVLIVEPFADGMPAKTEERLDAFVRENKIDGVIISTDPLNHKQYALWAARRHMHVLMDKPITTRRQAVSDYAQAAGIEEDYHEILGTYLEARRTAEACFIIAAHRRYHPGIELVANELEAVSAKTGCPVTNIHCFHGDGQLRLPKEIEHQAHHSYFDGHGKVSHSGYHFLDVLYRMVRAGSVPGKEYEEVRTYASFVQPDAFVRHVSRGDYLRLFGERYAELGTAGDDELAARFKLFGEMDCEAVFTFMRAGVPMCHATVSLLHNSFSRRSWMMPGKDLYKGNGRVKHEEHRVQAGPFFCAYIHSYQAKSDHRKSTAEDTRPGGNNHFDILLFYNKDMLGETHAMELVTSDQLMRAQGWQEEGLMIEKVKEGALREFVMCMRGLLRQEESLSRLEDHLMPVRLMSSIYRSHASRLSGGDPLITLPAAKHDA